MRILVVTANFYHDIAEMLTAGCKAELASAGVQADYLQVPGALEIPNVVAFASSPSCHVKYDGYVALGCVIRGETSHYDIVTEQSAAGLSKLAIERHLAIGNGVLTVENKKQAIVRADPQAGDKGGFAARATLQQISIKQKLHVG